MPQIGQLRMHRAGVDRAFRRRCPLRFAEVLCGIGRKLGAATGGTKIVGVTEILMPMGAGLRIDGHSTDGIGDGVSRRGRVIRMLMRLGSMDVMSSKIMIRRQHGNLSDLKRIPSRGI
jgi:hypothetical protein